MLWLKLAGVYLFVLVFVTAAAARAKHYRDNRRALWGRVGEVQFRTSPCFLQRKNEEAKLMRRFLNSRARALCLVALLSVSFAACAPSRESTSEGGGADTQRPRVSLADAQRFSRQLRAGIEAAAVVVLSDPKLSDVDKTKGQLALNAVRAADDEVQALQEGNVNTRAIAKAMLAASMSALPLIPMKDSTRGYLTLGIAGLSAFVTLAPDISPPSTPTTTVPKAI